MPAPRLSRNLPKLSDEDRAGEADERRLLARDRTRPAGCPAMHSAEWEAGFVELEAALAAPWKWDRTAPPVEEPPRRGVTIRREAPAGMSRRRAGDDGAPVVRAADPAEIADEEERRRLLPPGKLPRGFAVEAKTASGLGGWRSAIIEKDEGGHELDVRVSGRIATVHRSRIRPPKEKRTPRRVLAAVAQAAATGPPGVLPSLSGPMLPVVRSAEARRIGRQEGPAGPAGAPAFPKPKGRRECRRYRAFVRTWPCRSCGTRDGIQASHHGPKPTGRKTDDSRCIPLCYACHMGEGGFHDTGRLPGRPGLEGDALKVFLLDTMVELLTDYFWGSDEGGEVEQGPPLSRVEEMLLECLSEETEIEIPGVGP